MNSQSVPWKEPSRGKDSREQPERLGRRDGGLDVGDALHLQCLRGGSALTPLLLEPFPLTHLPCLSGCWI